MNTVKDISNPKLNATYSTACSSLVLGIILPVITVTA